MNIIITFAASRKSGSGGSGRARSDPSHHHHPQGGGNTTNNQQQSQSAHHGHGGVTTVGNVPSAPSANSGYGSSTAVSMDCESPGSQQARALQQQQLFARTAMNPNPQDVRTTWTTDVTHNLHNERGHREHGQPSMARHHSQPGSGSHQSSATIQPITHVEPSSHATVISRPGPGHSAQSSAPITIDLTQTQVPAFPQIPLHTHTNLEATHTGSVNMQLSGYQTTPPFQPAVPIPSYTAQPNFPFTLTTTAPGNQSLVTDSSTAHQRTAGERGDESPMVGVCVQQSPVASH